ncbi:hypothetical protein BKA62DRAFT_42626 [Auriculariales sp. MPI-PUGE-AT-0066]|nr:hypothetical protein BKA62DRAFT_42626 [Auriculariales sp. MPI-PUGE-AT-0066]
MLFASVAFVAAALAQATSAQVTGDRAASAYAFNNRVANATEWDSRHGERLARRAPAWDATHPGLKAKIDAAVIRTGSKVHYFWTGLLLPALSANDSVMNPTFTYATARGGTTLEQTMDGVPLPDWASNDADAEDIWNYASDEYAHAAKNDVYVVRGDVVRGGNVWDAFEYPRLKKSSAVKRIFEVKMHRTNTEQAYQIWPEVKGCDGVFFLDTHLTCPAGAKLFYSTPKRPVVTATTTVANDATIKIAASGNAAGITRECTEILRGEWILQQFTRTKACEAATKKGNGGKVMTQVKALLNGVQNRHYLQEQRLVKVKEKVTGPPIPGLLEKQLLDSLVSISYYEKNTQTTALLKQIDTLVKTATGVDPGLDTAWIAETAIQKPAKARLLALLQKQIAEKIKEQKEAQKRAGACGLPPPKKSNTARGLAEPRMAGVYSGAFIVSPVRRSSLEMRAQKTRTSGPKSPAAPSCPLKTAPQKKVVPRSKTTPKTPAKTPRRAGRSPTKKPANKNKKVVPRPANRARRAPGKPKPKRRATPKTKPKKVPKPTRRPKGKARARKTRRK